VSGPHVPHRGRLARRANGFANETGRDRTDSILGLEVTSAEDGAGWLAFFRGLVTRGLSGVVLVTSDAHAGLVAAIAATLPGASWQRCRTHCLGSADASPVWCPDRGGDLREDVGRW
jgi:Transposase, Mutator family